MICVQLTEEDTVSAHRLRTRGTWIVSALIVIVSEAAVIWIAYQQYQHRGHLYPDILMLMVALPIWLIMLRYVYEPWRMRRSFRNSPASAAPYNVTWDDTYLRFDGTDFSRRHRWNEFRNLRENSNLFILSLVNGSIHVVPKRSFAGADDAAHFRELVREKIVTRTA